MTVELKEKIFNIDVTLRCESQDVIEQWQVLLRDFFKDNRELTGLLELSGPPLDIATTRYWFKRASARENVEACFYDIKEDSLSSHGWKWVGNPKSTLSRIPIVSVGKNKTLFLDRDGVINVDDQYVCQKEKFVFMPGVFDLLNWSIEQNYQVVVLTNQSGVGRGYYTEEDVRSLHSWVDDQLEERGLKISGWFYSPFHPESPDPFYKKESYSRKPGSGLAIQAAEELSIDFENSIMIGDKISDRLLDLDIPTFFLQGSYDLKNNKGIFESHGDLIKYLKFAFS
jgi:D-glycero-D-manno-heptose 1,7-bisphosphate phosphatase